MIWKSKWPIWTGVLGTAGFIYAIIWFYLIIPHDGYYESRNIQGGINGVYIDGPMPLPIALTSNISLWMLLISIIVMSGSKWLRWIALLGTTSLAIALMCYLPEGDTSDAISHMIVVGHGLLLIAAITSIGIIITSWLKGRNKKLPTI
jgi:hypothetical protein